MAKRICYLCGEKYEYCPDCYQDRFKPAFMNAFHDENCNNIFDICTRYNMNLLTKAEAKDLLNKCDLSNRDNFKDCIKNDLDVIFDKSLSNSSNYNKRQHKLGEKTSSLHEVVSDKK